MSEFVVSSIGSLSNVCLICFRMEMKEAKKIAEQKRREKMEEKLAR